MMTQPEVRIRPVALEDAAAITALYGTNVLHGTASWEYEPPGVDEVRRRMQVILDAGYPYFVAEVEGKVLGYTYASSYRPRIGYRFVVEDSVYVDASLQGRGVGKRLMTQLIAACEQRGFHQMVAVIGDSENIASIRLHQAMGFVQVGLLPKIGFKFDRWLDSVLMQRTLKPPSN